MISAAVPIALAFDLVCSGMLRSGPVGLALPEQVGQPFEITYRIDLDSGRWCSDGCETVESVSSVFEGAIVLRDRHDDDGSNVVTVFPAGYRFTDTTIQGETATLRSGSCRAERFSGFPLNLA
ncbi:MAG: hypothetical protein JO276_15625 [Sphingomonadaceae bacterium]|nr:hypothetical protein [Sphingomonadaceae bacterium]